MSSNRLPLWQANWDQTEQAWDKRAQEAARHTPLKGLKILPQMVGITEETAKGLKWKSLKWMIQKDHLGEIRKGILKHPLKYAWAFLKSAIRSKPYQRQGQEQGQGQRDFFLYNLSSLSEFETLLQQPQTLLVLGFSYCHKPFECPSGRFSAACIHDEHHPVCQQCFIGKAVHASASEQTIPLFIPTVHYIGGKIFEIVHQNPDKTILFMITACEMTLEMFGDWGNMVGIRGVGVRLDGRICNTMKAFELSEQGIKPGLTVVREETQEAFLRLIRLRQEAF